MNIVAPIIFAIETYDYLGDAIAGLGGHTRGTVETKRFPDGEIYQRILTDISGRHVILIGGTIDDASTLALYDLGCALVKSGAQSLNLVIPYFGYSTMERAVRSGEVVKAKTRARLMSSIPLADSGNCVFLVDLHSAGLPHYFEGGVRPIHVYAKDIVKKAAIATAGTDFILACTDAGRAKWVESLANDLGVPAAFVFKRRLSGTETEVTAVSAQVQGKDVIIYDDMIRTGGSLIEAGKAYRKAGARKLWAIATHGVLPGESLNRIAASGLFEGVVTTDTHPRARALAGEFLRVESIAPLLHAQVVHGEHGIGMTS